VSKRSFFLAILNVGIASTRVVLTAGANVNITSGKETEISNVSWNVCEVKKGNRECIDGASNSTLLDCNKEVVLH
jgi:hypothetical protein